MEMELARYGINSFISRFYCFFLLRKELHDDRLSICSSRRKQQLALSPRFYEETKTLSSEVQPITMKNRLEN